MYDGQLIANDTYDSRRNIDLIISHRLASPACTFLKFCHSTRSSPLSPSEVFSHQLLFDTQRRAPPGATLSFITPARVVELRHALLPPGRGDRDFPAVPAQLRALQARPAAHSLPASGSHRCSTDRIQCVVAKPGEGEGTKMCCIRGLAGRGNNALDRGAVCGWEFLGGEWGGKQH